MASGAKAARGAAADVAQGVVAKQARRVLRGAEPPAAPATHGPPRPPPDAVAARPPRLEVTAPTGPRGGTPTGPPTKVPAHERPQAKRALERENATALDMAGHGYRVQQNPTAADVEAARRATGDIGAVGKAPDYLVESKVFDCYSPSGARSVRNLWSTVIQKEADGQAQRIVIDLYDWQGSVGALVKQFEEWSAGGLKEVILHTRNGDFLNL